jgi:hypothetical protein
MVDPSTHVASGFSRKDPNTHVASGFSRKAGECGRGEH